MGAFDSLKLDVLGVIKDFGAPFSVFRYAAGAPADAAKPWRPGAPSLTQYQGTGVLDKRMRKKTGKITDVVYLAASGLAYVPKTSDLVRINNLDRGIEEIEEIAPDGTPVLYVLYLGVQLDVTLLTTTPVTDFGQYDFSAGGNSSLLVTLGY